MQKGQISGNSSIANWLRALAIDPRVHTIVEIGSWEGMGSTRVIAEAVSNRPDAATVSILSLEANQARAMRAAKRNRSFPALRVLWGSIVRPENLNHENLSEEEREWLSEDLEALRTCPNVLELIPRTIDLLLLDGGEFSTRYEFEMLGKSVSKWLVLDDTKLRKSKDIAEAIREGSTPFCEVVDSSERNGFMIAVRKTSIIKND